MESLEPLEPLTGLGPGHGLEDATAGDWMTASSCLYGSSQDGLFTMSMNS
jgi:hypothetical protein